MSVTLNPLVQSHVNHFLSKSFPEYDISEHKGWVLFRFHVNDLLSIYLGCYDSIIQVIIFYTKIQIKRLKRNTYISTSCPVHS